MMFFSNLHRIRDFIKHVYVDRKYTGENSSLPMVRTVSVLLMTIKNFYAFQLMSSSRLLDLSCLKLCAFLTNDIIDVAETEV